MSEPRPYDLGDPAELARLCRELEGYMRVSLKDGTDTEGREYAHQALCKINRQSDQYVLARKLRDLPPHQST